MQRGYIQARRCPSCQKRFKCMSTQPDDRTCRRCYENKILNIKPTTDTSFILQQVARHK